MSDPATDERPEAHLRTAWHPLLILLLERLLPAELWRVVAEFALTREPRRIDAVIVRRTERLDAWRPTYLVSVLDDLRAHNVVHFKGATDELERADALQLLSYACQYMALEGLDEPALLSLRVVAPALSPRFDAQVKALGGSLAETTMGGVHDGRLGVFSLRVVETSVAWPHPHEHLLYAVSPEYVTHPERVRGFDDRERELFYHLAQGVAKLTSDPKWKAIMKDASLVESATGSALRNLLATLPLDVRLAGLKPEDVLPRFKPEERLVGLDASQAVLALPDEVLRGLSTAYIATLPEDVQSILRARLTR